MSVVPDSASVLIHPGAALVIEENTYGYFDPLFEFNILVLQVSEAMCIISCEIPQKELYAHSLREKPN